MASGFPGSIDNFTDPLTTSALNSPSHAGQHQDLNDAVEKIETYMGLVKVIPTSVSSAGGTSATLAADGTVTCGTGNTSVTITAFSALYDVYRIMVSDGTASTASVLQLRLGATASGYYSGFTYMNYGSNTLVGEQTSTGTLWTYAGEMGPNGNHAEITLTNPFLAKRSFISSFIGQGGGSGYVGYFAGLLNDTTSYASFSIIPNTGTVSGAKIRVYGYRN